MTGTSLRDLICVIAMGLVVSAVALFVLVVFSHGLALGVPAIVISVLAVGPALSLATWTFLNAASSRTGSTNSEAASIKPGWNSSPLRNLLVLFWGALLSLPLFLVVVYVEHQFRGELAYSMFGPYYTHPHRPLSGRILCLLGLATGVILYHPFKMRHVAVGISLGSIALGLMLIFAK